MQHFCPAKFLTSFLCAFSALFLNAQNFNLVKDINDSKDANPQNQQYGISEGRFAVANKLAYFTADDGIHGSELWLTDGKAAGTKLVKDINNGTAGSNIKNITKFRNGVIFSASNSPGTYGIWTSDGTDAGTFLLADITSANNYAISASVFTPVNNDLLFFMRSNHAPNDELWATDGTPAGTHIVEAFPKFSTVNPETFTGFNGKLFFTLYDNNTGDELWVSDGTNQGTKLYKDIYPGIYSGIPLGLSVLNKTLLFFATDNGSVTSLWQTHGDSADVTKIVDNVGDFVLSSFYVHTLAVGDSTLYFDIGNGLLRYNIASAGIVERLTYMQGFDYTMAGSTIFFVTDNKLYKTDGKSAEVFVTRINDNSLPFSSNDPLLAIDGNVYFTYNDTLHGTELWKSDGTPEGTYMVRDVFEGIYSSMPSSLTAFGKTLLFAANNGIAGNELWKSNDDGTSMVLNINQITTANASPDLNPVKDYVVNSKNQLLFAATNARYGYEAYVTDGTAAGTQILKDMLPGLHDGIGASTVAFGQPPLFTNFKNNSYFFSTTNGGVLPLWQTDGTIAGTRPVDSFTYNGYGDPQAYTMLAGKNMLYCYVSHDGYGFLYALQDDKPKLTIKEKMDNSFVPEFMATGDTLFFVNNSGYEDNYRGKELWMTDGTLQNTKIVKDINPAARGSSNPTNLMIMAGKLYFSADEGTGKALWVSDGSEAGTKPLKKITLSLAQAITSYIPDYYPYSVSAGKLFFVADDGAGAGYELWVTDGTEAGTQLVKDINPGTANSGISNMIELNGTLFFTATDAIHGYELWKTDGTSNGTMMVKDLNAGSGSTYIYDPVINNGMLYFYANSSIWQSDGTQAGTKLVSNLATSGLSRFAGMAAAGDNLYISASSYAYGSELYILKLSALPISLLSFTGQLVKNDAALTWKTTNEINNSYFNVQRSINGNQFINVGKILAAGSSTELHSYSFTDANITAFNTNVLFYRLQQVDKDGKATFSNIIKLSISNIDDLVITPNPAHKTAYLHSSTTINKAQVIITDMTGHVLYNIEQNIQAGQQVPIDVAHFAAGTYTITVQAKGTVQKQFKIVLQ